MIYNGCNDSSSLVKVNLTLACWFFTCFLLVVVEMRITMIASKKKKKEKKSRVERKQRYASLKQEGWLNVKWH